MPRSRFGPECYVCPDCCMIPFGMECPLADKPKPGPPPACLRPPMPPKFLPVPTEPVLSPVRPDAPEPRRGDIEVGYRPQLTSPGHD
jgi:hypothetical protein